MKYLKPYPETSDFGLAWLGVNPVHWEIVCSKIAIL